MGEEQIASDILNREFCGLHRGRETACEGAERRAKQVRSVLQDTGHLQGDGCPSATPRPSLSHPSAAPWPRRAAGRVAHAKPKAFISALQIAERAYPGHSQAYLFIYSFTREGRRSKANRVNEKLSYLIMQNKVLHDTATFRVTLFKKELPNKDC